MTFLIGVFFVFISGMMVGSVMVPIKFMRRYDFEHYWMVYNLVGTLLIPWGMAFGTVPNLITVYRQLPLSTLIIPAGFGFGWGIASTLGGLCVSRIGLSLTYALISGIGACAGAIIPLLYFSPRTLSSIPGGYIMLGAAVMIAGLVIVAKAGREKELKEKQLKKEKMELSTGRVMSRSFIQGSFSVGLALTILAGILSAGLNFSFAFGQDISLAAVTLHASKTSSINAVWAIAMLGGMIPNLAYACIRCTKNNSWNRFAMSPTTDVPLSMLMGVLFMGSVSFYGWGALRLGLLGTSVGWVIVQISQIVTGNVAGLLAGEWRVASGRPTRRLFGGLSLLIVASVFMGYGNYLQDNRKVGGGGSHPDRDAQFPFPARCVETLQGQLVIPIDTIKKTKLGVSKTADKYGICIDNRLTSTVIETLRFRAENPLMRII